MDTTEGDCDSCGAPDDELVLVRRIYLTTDGEGRVIGQQVQPDLERWCLACRTLYPHEQATD